VTLARRAKSVPVRVESYSGYKADERPVRFATHDKGAGWVAIRRVIREWREPDAECFVVEAESGYRHQLRHDTLSDSWTLEASSPSLADR
jgi:hypothetical protein